MCKILYIHHSGSTGGAPQSLLGLVSEMRRQGKEVAVCNSRLDRSVDELYNSNGIPTYRYKISAFHHTTLLSANLLSLRGIFRTLKWLFGLPYCVWNLICLLRLFRPDIVHLNSFTLCLYLPFIKILKIKTVLHVREGLVSGAFGVRRRIMTQCTRLFADHVIAICVDNASSLAGATWRSDSRWNISVIYNPVSEGKFYRRDDTLDCRSTIGLPADSFVVTFVGGSEPTVKGLEDFILLLDLLADRIPHLFGAIVGLKNWRASSPLIAATWEKMKSRVVAVGFSNEVEEWISASDVVCVLHKTNHFSRTLLESWAVCRPTVSYDLGSLHEVVARSNGGLEVVAGDLSATADAVVKLHENIELRRELAEAGRRWVVDTCSPRVGAEAVNEIYKSLFCNYVSS